MFFQKCSFTFDSITSTTNNVIMAEFNPSSIQSYDYGLSNTSIIESEISRKDKPFFLGISSSPMSFDVTLVRDDGTDFTNTQLADLYTWLMKDYYASFVSDDDTTIQYKAIFTNPQARLVGSRKVAVTFELRCDSPYPYLLEQEDDYTVTTSQALTIDMTDSNYKKYYSNVEIEFTTSASETDVSIENVTDGRTTTFTGLNNSETIYINNERKELLSDTTLNRFDKFNLVWFRLVPEVVNNITVTGDCEITFRYSLPTLI